MIRLLKILSEIKLSTQFPPEIPEGAIQNWVAITPNSRVRKYLRHKFDAQPYWEWNNFLIKPPYKGMKEWIMFDKKDFRNVEHEKSFSTASKPVDISDLVDLPKIRVR